MKKLFNVIDRYLFSRFDPVSLGFSRITLGGLIVLYYLCLYPNWTRFYAADGVASFVNGAPGGLTPIGWSIFAIWPVNVPLQLLWWVGFLAAVGFTLGYRTRMLTVILYLMICWQINWNSFSINGEDLLFRMLLFWGMFSPLGHCLSLDNWFRRRNSPAQPPALPMNWPVRGMQINFVLIYAFSLPLKLMTEPAWAQGDAVYWTIASNLWSRWPWPEMFCAAGGILSKFFTWGTLLLEGAFVLLIWVPRPRLKLTIVVLLATLHLGIAVMLQGATFFSLSMLAGLWLFVPAQYSRWLADNLFRDVRKIHRHDS